MNYVLVFLRISIFGKLLKFNNLLYSMIYVDRRCVLVFKEMFFL